MSKVHSLHAELNSLEGYDIPNICRDLAIHYIKGGQYAKDLNLIVSMIDDYFKSLRPSENGLDVVLIDIDDIVPSNPYSSDFYHRFHNDSISNCVKEEKDVKLIAQDSDSIKGNEYFSRQRSVIQKKGFHIKSIISSHFDVLTAPDNRIRNFLLPGHVCDKFEHQIESIDTGH
ncbi:hypothetical protein TSUD_151160 [Trifolium subterraneum]|uniref:Uncharacterized protein n=1 Tax=Trifolium subterraneum TaxID=3900 RepID=A0A2Z6NUP6_TRISU|nr:hypothetical protein TSUD_151160 [Trifolium subterraneum]